MNQNSTKSNTSNIKSTKSHRSANGWNECSAVTRPCPLGGVHVNNNVVPVLNFLDKQHFEYNPQNTAYLEKIKQAADDDSLLISKEIKKSYEALREAINQKDDAEINLFKEDFEIGQQIYQQKKNQVKEARKSFDKLRKQLSIRLTDLSDAELYEQVSAGKVFHTQEQVKTDSQLADLHNRNSYLIRRNEMAKKLANKTPEVELQGGAEFFRASPSLSNTFGNQQMVGATAIETYNNAIKQLILDNVQGNRAHVAIAEKLRAVKFLRSQLEATAEAAYDHKTKELKRSSSLLSNRSAKALHKAHGLVLKEFFTDLSDSTWDSRIKSEN